MTEIEEINKFFSEYGEHYDIQVINYTKKIVHRIRTSSVLERFLKDNNINSFILLNEITPYCQFKYSQNGDEKLDMKEFETILNIILFSNELEKMIMDDHIVFSSIGPLGELYYKADKYASTYFNNKFDINIKENVEFDFTILDDKNIKYGFDDFGFN